MRGGAGRAGDKKFFVRVTECWPYACESDMSKKFNATESLRYKYKGVATFSVVARPQIGVSSSQWSCTFCMMSTSAASDRVLSMLGHFVISRRIHLKSSSMKNIHFFSSALKAKHSIWPKGSHILIYSVFKNFCWLLNEPLNKLPPAMTHVARAFSCFRAHNSF